MSTYPNLSFNLTLCEARKFFENYDSPETESGSCHRPNKSQFQPWISSFSLTDDLANGFTLLSSASMKGNVEVGGVGGGQPLKNKDSRLAKIRFQK